MGKKYKKLSFISKPIISIGSIFLVASPILGISASFNKKQQKPQLGVANNSTPSDFDIFSYLATLEASDVLLAYKITKETTLPSQFNIPTIGTFPGKYSIAYTIKSWVQDDENGTITLEMNFSYGSFNTIKNITITGLKSDKTVEAQIAAFTPEDFVHHFNISQREKALPHTITRPPTIGTISSINYRIDSWLPSDDSGEISFEITFSYGSKTRNRKFKISNFKKTSEVKDEIQNIDLSRFIAIWTTIDKTKFPANTSKPAKGKIGDFDFDIKEWNQSNDTGTIEFKVEISSGNIKVIKTFTINGFLKTQDIVDAFDGLTLQDFLTKFNINPTKNVTPSSVNQPQPVKGVIKGINYEIKNWTQKDDSGEIDFSVELTKNGIIRTYHFVINGLSSIRDRTNAIDDITNTDLEALFAITLKPNKLPSEVSKPTPKTTANGINVSIKQLTWDPQDENGEIHLTVVFTNLGTTKERTFVFYGFKTITDVETELNTTTKVKVEQAFGINDKDKVPTEIKRPSLNTGMISSNLLYDIKNWVQNDDEGSLSIQLELRFKDRPNIKVLKTFKIDGFKTNKQVNALADSVSVEDFMRKWNISTNDLSVLLPHELLQKPNGTIKGIPFVVKVWNQVDSLGKIEFVIEYTINGKKIERIYKMENMLTTDNIISELDAVTLNDIFINLGIDISQRRYPTTYSKPNGGTIGNISFTILSWNQKDDVGEIEFRVQLTKNGHSKIYTFTLTGFKEYITSFNDVTLTDIKTAFNINPTNSKLPSKETMFVGWKIITTDKVKVELKAGSWIVNNETGEISFIVILSKGSVTSERTFTLKGYKTTDDVIAELNNVLITDLITKLNLSNKNKLSSEFNNKTGITGIIKNYSFTVEKWITDDQNGELIFEVKLEKDGVTVIRTFKETGYKTLADIENSVNGVTTSDFEILWNLNNKTTELPNSQPIPSDGIVKQLSYSIKEWVQLDDIGRIKFKVEFSVNGKVITRNYVIQGFLTINDLVKKFNAISLLQIKTKLGLNPTTASFPPTTVSNMNGVIGTVAYKVEEVIPNEDIGVLVLKITLSEKGVEREYIFTIDGYKSKHVETLNNFSTGNVMKAFGIIANKTKLPSGVTKPNGRVTLNGIALELVTGSWTTKDDLGQLSFQVTLTKVGKTVTRSFTVFNFKTIEEIVQDFQSVTSEEIENKLTLDKNKLPSEQTSQGKAITAISNGISFSIKKWIIDDQTGKIIIEAELSKMGQKRNFIFTFNNFVSITILEAQLNRIRNEEMSASMKIDFTKTPSGHSTIQPGTIIGHNYTIISQIPNNAFGELEIIVEFNTHGITLRRKFVLQGFLNNGQVIKELESITFDDFKGQNWGIKQDETKFASEITSRNGATGTIGSISFKINSWEAKTDLGEIHFLASLTKNGMTINKLIKITGLIPLSSIMRQINNLTPEAIFRNWNIALDKENTWPTDQNLGPLKGTLKGITYEILANKDNQTGKITFSILFIQKQIPENKILTLKGFKSIDGYDKKLAAITDQQIIDALWKDNIYTNDPTIKPVNGTIRIGDVDVTFIEWRLDKGNKTVTAKATLSVNDSKYTKTRKSTFEISISKNSTTKEKGFGKTLVIALAASGAVLVLIVLLLLMKRKNKFIFKNKK